MCYCKINFGTFKESTSELHFIPKVSEPIDEVAKKLKALEMIQPRVNDLE